MRRWIYIATFGLVLLSLPAWAQRGGGGGHAGSGGGFASHSSGFSHSPGFSHSSGSLHSGSFSRGSGVRVQAGRQFGNHFNRRRVFVRNGFGYPYGLDYPYAGYYPWYLDSFNGQYADQAQANDQP